MLLLDVVRVDSDGESEDPVGEAEDVIVELQRLLEVLVRDAVLVSHRLLWIV